MVGAATSWHLACGVQTQSTNRQALPHPYLHNTTHDATALTIATHTHTNIHTQQAAAKAGGANLDWNNLGFEFRPTRSHIKFVWKNGKWDEVREKREGVVLCGYVGRRLSSVGRCTAPPVSARTRACVGG